MFTAPQQLAPKLAPQAPIKQQDNQQATDCLNATNLQDESAASWQLECKYTLSEVQQHSSLDDCWMVIFDKVYNITEFVDEHPGGDYILLEYAGRDATHPFLSSRHGSLAYKLLDKYWIGILVDEELYYSNNSSYCSVYSNLSWRRTPSLDNSTATTATSTSSAPISQTISTDDNDSEPDCTPRAQPEMISSPLLSSSISSPPATATVTTTTTTATTGVSALDECQEAQEKPEEGATSGGWCSRPASLAQLWSKATRAVLRSADKTAALGTRSPRAQCVRHIALASGWHIL